MRLRTSAFLCLAAGSALAMGIACSSSSSGDNGGDAGTGGGSGSSSGSGSNTIVIGVSNSLTGGLQGIGAPLSNAIKVAQSQINSSGGILGKQLNFLIQDDTSDELSSADDGGIVFKNVTDLINKGAVAIIGPNGSGQVAAIAPYTTSQKIIELSATATSVSLSGGSLGTHDRYFFRTVPPDDFQGKAVVKFALQGPQALADAGSGGDGGATGGVACAKMALFYYSNQYGEPMAGVIKTEMAKTAGTSIVADVTVDTVVKASYQTEVGTIVAAKPDCLAMIVYDDVGDAFLTDMKAAIASSPWNPSFFIIGTDGSYTESLITNGKPGPGQPSVAEGIYGTNPDTNPLTKEYSDFKTLYTSQFPLPAGQDDIDAYASNQYDAAMLVALAIQKAGGVTDKVALRDALYAVSKGGKAHGPADFVGAIADIQNGVDIDYNGASGPVDLQDDGNVQGGYIVWHVNGGKFETVERIKASDLQ